MKMNFENQISGSIFKVLASIFKKHSIQAVLVGGYAVISYKIQRVTFDIDFFVTSGDYQKIESDMFALGYSIFNKTDAFVQLRGNGRGLRDIDFLLGDGPTVQGLLSNGRSVTIAGESFTVPSPQHLIAMKLHSLAGNSYRELKDFPDIVQIMIANTIDPKSDEIKSLFNKYHAMEIYERVIKAISEH
jgi:hypothetical protein